MIRCVSPSPAMDVTYLLSDLRSGEMNRPTRMLRRAGGKAFNVARVVRALGGQSVVLGPIGGLTGEAIERAALEEGIPFRPVTLVGHESRTCLSIYSEDGTPSTDINQRVEPVGDAWDQLIASLPAHPSQSTAISGSLPPDVTADQLTELAKAARPGLLAVDIHGPAARAWFEGSPDIDVLKVNESEARDLLEGAAPRGRSEAADLARTLQTLCGAALVIVTQGTEGSIACTKHEMGFLAATPPGPYPVGSGDAFMAGLLTNLPPPPWSLADDVVRDSLRWAAAAAGVNAHHLGAGSVSRAEVADLAGSVRFTSLA